MKRSMRIGIASATRRVAAVLVVGALAMAAGAFVLPAVEAAFPTPLFEEIGTLERFPEDARKELGPELVPTWETVTTDPLKSSMRHKVGAIAIPEFRQLWQLYYTNPPADPVLSAAVVRDLDTLEIIRTVRLPAFVRRDTSSPNSGGDWTHAVDTVHGRLFLVGEGNRSVMEIDLRSFAITRRPLPAEGLTNLAGRDVSGLFVPVIGATTYDPYRDDLLFLFAGPANQSAANTNTFLYTLDVSGPPSSGGTVEMAQAVRSFHQVRSCTAPVTSTDAGNDLYNWEILVTETHLYIPCQRVGHTGVVVRMARPVPGGQSPPEQVAVGPVYVESALADQAAGRLVITTSSDKEIWTFEAATMSFVGLAATGPPGNLNAKTGFGLDRTTGRVFFQSPKFGLGVVEGRFFPLPQARTVDRKVEGRERILSDARTNRVFVLEGFERRARAYRIYRVAPAPVPPPPPDPDRNTVDREEQSGLTEARYNASASGYGARALLAKGVVGAVPAPVAGVIAPTSDFFENNTNSRCGFTDRELVAGRVFRSEYDTGSAAAEAIAVEVDGATKQDLDKPSRCDVVQKGNSSFKGLFGTVPQLDESTQHTDDDPKKPGNESRWRWSRASCSSSEGRPGTGTGGTDRERTTRTDLGPDTTTSAGFGPSSVSCPEPGGVLAASATARLQGDLSVGRAWTETKVERSSEKGVVSTVTSVAQDVRLALADGLVVSFAEIRSSAASAADGRPPETRPMSSHQVLIRGARLNGAPLPGCDPAATRECGDLTGVVDALNTAAAGRAVFRTGTGDNSGLDDALVEGSRRGAQTAVQKSPARQASDRSLTGDFTVEVPGLEVLTFNDNTRWGRARQLYQFAGVASTATYNVVLRPTGLGLPDLGPFEGSFGNLEAPVEAAGADGFSSSGDDGGDEGTAFDAATASDSGDDEGGGGFWAPFRAVARGLRVFLTDPRHALLLLTAWALLGLPGALSRRRRLLVATRSG